MLNQMPRPTLEELDLSGNSELSKLPEDWIGEMTNLKKLNVSECSLTELPQRFVNHKGVPSF